MSNTNEEKVAWANKIAQEIESGSDYKQRNDLELDEGVSEEDKFSAVHRDVARYSNGFFVQVHSLLDESVTTLIETILPFWGVELYVNIR